jgi:CheY-like chemotaxis protein
VDDSRRFLNGVSALLAQTFDVVGVATNGLQALDAVRLLDPDVIVLDVDMPELDGLQTCRALQQSGSAAPPVVFLSMHDSDAVVSAAFQCGGRGYVLKQRVGRDLVHALDQALSGRSFVPSLGSAWPLAGGGLHVMQLYDDEATFADGIAALFDLSLRNGEATCIIADREVRDALAERLRARGWDVGGSSGCQRYLALDARDAVNRFMRGGLPDPERLAEIAGELDDYRRAVVSEGSTSRLTLCGNMVVSLIADGNAKAAMALERHWNRLTRERPILTVCGYSSSCFHDDIPDLWSRACTEHGALSLAADA